MSNKQIIIKEMKAAILAELHQDLVVDTIQLPSTLTYGQVLVKVLYSSICGSQIGEIDGAKGEDKYLPHLLGHEGSGEVLEIGPGVQTVMKGDHVVLHWKKGSGIDAQMPKYKWKGRCLNAGAITSFNEYAVISENRLTSIPKDFDSQHAALLGCAVLTGLGVITNDAQVKIGESIVALGAGGVGLNVIQGASMVSAHPIIAVDLYDKKLELARSFGATHTLNAKNTDVKKEIMNILGSDGADVIVENTGNVDLIEMAYELTKPQGRTILVGVPKHGQKASLYTLPVHFGKILSGSHGGEAKPEKDIPRYINLVNAGKLQLDGLITHHFDFNDINLAIRQMKAGEVTGRCMLKMC
ncbi:MAG: S-(hydroxymethyl)glutathione dehydrogenase/alcohol dehydrogenase [Chlamydiales bacterium]|jgi:S-(hydroxymethyl)glutathione dehydrogenase/alcohol dehydrogenase